MAKLNHRKIKKRLYRNPGNSNCYFLLLNLPRSNQHLHDAILINWGVPDHVTNEGVHCHVKGLKFINPAELLAVHIDPISSDSEHTFENLKKTLSFGGSLTESLGDVLRRFEELQQHDNNNYNSDQALNSKRFHQILEGQIHEGVRIGEHKSSTTEPVKKLTLSVGYFRYRVRFKMNLLANLCPGVMD